jgi:hypothetical protein
MSIYESGMHYGYPECCIESFRELLHFDNRSLYEALLPKASLENTGFIPCVYHLNQLATGSTHIGTLLSNRVCQIPFPKGHRNSCSCPKNLKTPRQIITK